MTEVMRSGPRLRNHSAWCLTRSFTDQPPLEALLRLRAKQGGAEWADHPHSIAIPLMPYALVPMKQELAELLQHPHSGSSALRSLGADQEIARDKASVNQQVIS
jgi:hypothetical protein